MKPLDKVAGVEVRLGHHDPDENPLYLKILSDPSVTLDTLDWCFEGTTTGWMRVNNLMLNPITMEVLRVGSDSIPGSGPVLRPVEVALTICSVGGLLDAGLLLEGQVVSVAREAYYRLRWVLHLRPCLDKRDLARAARAKFMDYSSQQHQPAWPMVREDENCSAWTCRVPRLAIPVIRSYPGGMIAMCSTWAAPEDNSNSATWAEAAHRLLLV